MAERLALVSVGFTMEGTLRGAGWLLGRYTDTHLFSLVRSDWSPPEELRADL